MAAGGDGSLLGEVCITEPDTVGGDCEPPGDQIGCCVLSEGNCHEDVTFETCDGGASIAWFLDTDCSEVPECAPLPKNIPTLSGWGLLSLAVVLGVLGIVGFLVIRRRKVTA